MHTPLREALTPTQRRAIGVAMAEILQAESHDVLREDYPYVPEATYEVALLWARENPRRGRPARPGAQMYAVALAARSVTFPP